MKIGSTVTHTVTYDAATSKTVSVEAHFDTTETNLKLSNYIIPVEKYEHGTGYLESGSTVLTFPAKVVDPCVYILVNEWDKYVIHIYDNDGFSKYAPYIHNGAEWVRYS